VLRLRARFPAATAEAVLGPLLACAPFGVHERPVDGEVELVLHGREEDMRAARALLGGAGVAEPAPEDGHERLAAVLRPATVAGVAVRAEWMPPDPAAEDEILLADVSGFGSGSHPTTRACLEWVLALPPGGSFADLGCGSGVLAIAAAKRGRSPVLAVDREEAALTAAAVNARANGVEIHVVRADLLQDPPPAADAVAANVPPDVHQAMSARLPAGVERLVASGFAPEEAATVAAAYQAAGLAVAAERTFGEWAMLSLRGLTPGCRSLRTQPLALSGQTPTCNHLPAQALSLRGQGRVGRFHARWCEQGARCELLDLGRGVHLDVWPLGDSLRWAVRAPEGTEVAILGQRGEGRHVAMAVRIGRRRADVEVDVGPGPVHVLHVSYKVDACVNF
jgi:ribosomal protein L11 methyltransferase